jgi:hypothetical protein
MLRQLAEITHSVGSAFSNTESGRIGDFILDEGKLALKGSQETEEDDIMGIKCVEYPHMFSSWRLSPLTVS